MGIASCECILAADPTLSMDQCLQSFHVVDFDACERAVLNEPETADWLACYTQELVDKAECLEQTCADDCYFIVADCPWTSDIAEALVACE